MLCPFWLLLSSCLKKNDVTLNHGAPLTFSGKDMVKTLAGESSLKLFYTAFIKLSLDKEISADKGFTIFALTDSAMTAAGLNAATINKLSTDSLRKLISYQIVSGSFSNTALTNSVTASQLNTLKIDTFINANAAKILQSEPVFVKLQGSFYFNGVAISQSKAGIQTTNGLIYPVAGLAPRISSSLLLDIIDNDPDLSMYRLAISVADSVQLANGYSGTSLTALFGTLPDKYHHGLLPTILAPTNQAFYNAGFRNIQDLQQLATRYYSGYDPSFSFVIYSSIDSLLGHHLIYNDLLAQGTTGAVRVLYNDFLTLAINNNTLNNFLGFNNFAYLKYPVPLTFTASGSTARVKWTNDPSAAPVTLPLDASPQHPVNNFIAANGALYKIDKLFYPIAK